MSQHGVDFPSLDPSGTDLLDTYLDDFQEDVLTNHSGTSRPSYVRAGMTWLDITTNPWLLKIFNGTDDIVLGSANTATLVFTQSGPTLVSSDTAPQLGGDLDVNGKKITSVSNGNIILQPNGTGAVVVGGGATQPCELRFPEDSDNGVNYVGLKAPATLSGNKVWQLPANDGSAGQYLKTDGSAVLDWATLVTPGASTSILKGNGSGGFSNAAAGTDYLAPGGDGSALTGLTASQVSGILGVSQTWQNVASSRAINTSYQNSTGRPIQLAIISSSGASVQASSNNSTWITVGGGGSDRNTDCNAIIPDSYYYRVSGGGFANWAELR